MNNFESPASGPIDSTVEQEAPAPIKPVPGISLANLQDNIVSAHYFTAGNGISGNWEEPGDCTVAQFTALKVLTFCVLILRNGSTVVGEAACAIPENYDYAIAKKVARFNAELKIWPLMEYVRKDRVAERDAKSTDSTP